MSTRLYNWRMSRSHAKISGSALAFILGAASVAGNIAHAQGEGPVHSETVLSLRLEGLFTDNMYYQRDNQLETSGVKLKPEVEFSRISGLMDITAQAWTELGSFSHGSSDDYVDAYGALASLFKMSRFINVGLSGVMQKQHDPFGTERTEGQDSFDRDLDIWEQSTLGLTIGGGQDDSSRLEYQLRADWHEKEYQTNRDQTRFLDKDILDAELGFEWKFSPKFGLLLTAGHKDIEFKDVAAGSTDRSGSADFALLGGRWHPSPKLFLKLQGGQARWTPDLDSEEEDDSSFWRGDIKWQMSKNSSLQLSSQRRYEPTFRFDARFVDSREHRINWRHQWNFAFESVLSGGLTDVEYVGADEEQEYESLDLTLNYFLDSEYSVFARFGHTGRNSELESRTFDQQYISAGVEARFN